MKSRFWARIASASIVLFLILLAALHFLEPEYDPSRHLISEYELGRYGWMMSLDFFSLGVSVFAMVFSTWYSSTTRRGLVGRWCFLAISVAFFGAGVFRPHITPNLASYLHGICGIIIILTFPIAASLYNSGLAHSQEWAGSRRLLSWMTWLVWVGLLSFVGSTIALGILAGPVNRSQATLLIGWQNRLMILTYSLWPIIAAWPVVISKNRDL